MSYQTVLPLLVSDHYSYVPKHMDCRHKHLYQFHSHHLKIEIKKTVSVHVYYTLFILKDEFVKGYGYTMHLNLTSDIFLDYRFMWTMGLTEIFSGLQVHVN